MCTGTHTRTLCINNMSQNQLRYNGEATVKQSYMSEFVVECPKCHKDAIVTSDSPWHLSNGKLTCHNCSFKQEESNIIRYSAEVRRNCDNCGKLFHSIIPPSKAKIEQISIKCPNCKKTREYKPRYTIVKEFYPNTGRRSDPIFNLTLWYQAPFKKDVLWAFNKKHLMEIKAYVESKLRERQTTTHTTMVERLPSFITSSKNRTAILKTIDKLIKP